jgi:hypothetical protein
VNGHPGHLAPSRSDTTITLTLICARELKLLRRWPVARRVVGSS